MHIARGFLGVAGTRKERAIKALAEVGPPVFHAAFSTLLPILVLPFSNSYIFKSMFWGFFTLLVAAILHGLILVPILLSLFGPPGFYDTEEEKAMSELELEEIATNRAYRGKDVYDNAEAGVPREDEATAEDQTC